MTTECVPHQVLNERAQRAYRAALAGAHSTESANAPPAKVAPATQPAAQPAALSILLNHWGAAVRRCLSTCVDRYHPASPDDDHAA